ncbi:MAG TPA: LuxR C-terminal-related transcriptional regulator, partial [Paludibacteraceae bacterium]|nr:LuxR C-terminal-related transcriptional regulator [Paludibacteraceae bacterium]
KAADGKQLKNEASGNNNSIDVLSDREKDILKCVARGMSNKEIADKLFLSIHTVTTHRRNITSKLQIYSTAGLTIYAIINKLVDIADINLQ